MISLKSLLEIAGFPKGKYVDVSSISDRSDIADDLYDLIDTAYKPLGGHVKFRSVKDVLNQETDVWSAADIDADPELDVVAFGKKTPFGIKHTGMGHDGDKSNIKDLLIKTTKQLKTRGNYIEVSGPAFNAFVVKGGVPTVDDEHIVRKVLGSKGKDIVWFGTHPEKPNLPGEGWYGRKIGGGYHIKIMAGIPKI